MHSFFLASLLGALLCAPVLATAQAPATAAPRTAYVLGPDDQITIQVADAPDISGKPQRIDPNGDLRLPDGRARPCRRLDGRAARSRARSRLLKVHLQEPDVAVTVTEFRSQPVSVIGAVGKSGVRQLEGRKTLIEMLSLAGGVTADAGPTLRITRRLDRGADSAAQRGGRPERRSSASPTSI